MADQYALVGLLEQAGNVFTLAGNLGRTIKEQRQEGRAQFDDAGWAQLAPTFEQFCQAVLILRDAIQHPPDGFSSVAEYLNAAARIAKGIRDVMQSADGRAFAAYLEFSPELFSVEIDGWQAIRAVPNAQRQSDPFGFVDGPDNVDAAKQRITMLEQYANTTAGHVKFLEFVRRDVHFAAEMSRSQFAKGYSNATLASAVHVDLWLQARVRMAAISDLPADVVKKVVGVLGRELTVDTVEHVDDLLEPAVRALRDALETARNASSGSEPIEQPIEITQASRTALPVGSSEDSGLEIIEPIDSGLYGRVYRGRQKDLDRPVAVKIIKQEFSHRADAVGHARALARVGVHPNIVAVYGVEDVSIEGVSMPAMVMEWLDGEKFGTRLAGPRFSLQEVRRICTGVLDGMNQMHRAGIQHGDLHFGNVILLADCQPKIIDVDATQNRSLGRLSEVSREGAISADLDYCRRLVHQAASHSDVSLSAVNLLDVELRSATTIEDIRTAIERVLETTAPILESQQPIATTANMFLSLKDAVLTGKSFVSPLFVDYLNSFMASLEEFRITLTNENRPTFDELVMDSITRYKSHRDNFVECLLFMLNYAPGKSTTDSLFTFLEQLLPYQDNPEKDRGRAEESTDNYRFIILELFLYLIAACLRLKQYETAAFFMEAEYHSKRRLGSNESMRDGFEQFNNTPVSLETWRYERLKASQGIVAETIHARAPSGPIAFPELLQADMLLHIRSSFPAHGAADYWHPRCAAYAMNYGVMDLFSRATGTAGLQTLTVLLKIKNMEDLMVGLQRLYDQASSSQLTRRLPLAYRTMLNIDELSQISGQPVGRR